MILLALCRNASKCSACDLVKVGYQSGKAYSSIGLITESSVVVFQVEIDHISDIDEWQTSPGRLILGFRLAIMLWFLVELRTTFLVESSVKNTQFYLHFGAGFLVWFVYLPIVAFVCAWLSALNRYKTVACEYVLNKPLYM